MLIAELLFGLLALVELVVILVVGLLQLALAVFTLVVELIAAIVGAAVGAKRQRVAVLAGGGADAGDATEPPPSKTSASATRFISIVRGKWFRRLTIASLCLLAISAVALVLLTTVWFESSVRWIFARAEQRTGTSVRFESASGNLWLGRINLANATIQRRDHPSTVFDLQARSLAIDLDLPSLLFGPRRVEMAEVVGLRGTIDRVAAAEQHQWFVNKSLLIDQLRVSHAQVRWTDHSRTNKPLALAIEVDELQTDHLRSRWVAFDMLLRTNASGRINESPFRVHNRSSDGERVTEWSFGGIPAPIVGLYIGGPFTWLHDGHANIEVRTTWSDRPDADALNMDWSFEFVDVRAEVPPHLTGWQARLATALVEHVNRHGQRLPLAFTLAIARGKLEGSASPEAAGLWQAIESAATSEIASLLKVDAEKVQEWRDQGVEQLRSIRDRVRGSRADDEEQPTQ